MTDVNKKMDEAMMELGCVNESCEGCRYRDADGNCDPTSDGDMDPDMRTAMDEWVEYINNTQDDDAGEWDAEQVFDWGWAEMSAMYREDEIADGADPSPTNEEIAEYVHSYTRLSKITIDTTRIWADDKGYDINFEL